jgi:holliday junction DNA helicase RuvA
MFDYLQGKIVELTPTYLVLEISGIGYLMHITVNTYSALKLESIDKIYAHQIIREDAHLFYGFKNKKERDVFRMLISVSGIGANTARMILSSLTPDETAQAIVRENVMVLQNIKGIGAKTAQRMIVELKDKMAKVQVSEEILIPEYNTFFEEALSALVMLGFQKSLVEKTLMKIASENRNLTVEEMIRRALKVL